MCDALGSIPSISKQNYFLAVYVLLSVIGTNQISRIERILW